MPDRQRSRQGTLHATAEMEMSAHVQPAGAIAASLDEAAPRRGALFKVQHDGRTSYLFGTVHAGKQAFFPLEPQVTRALADSNALVLELDVRASEPFQLALAAHGRYPKGDSIRNHLSQETLALLQQALGRAGMSLDNLEQYRPWLLANLLIGAEIERHGYMRSQGAASFSRNCSTPWLRMYPWRSGCIGFTFVLKDFSAMKT
eukprot:gene37444-46193_t